MAKVKIKVPKLGLTIESIKLASWDKSVGDQVAAGETFGSMEADKASYDVESPVDGIIAELALADDDTDYDVGSIIAVIEV